MAQALLSPSYDVAYAVAKFGLALSNRCMKFNPIYKVNAPKSQGIDFDHKKETVEQRHQAVIEAIDKVKALWRHHCTKLQIG